MNDYYTPTIFVSRSGVSTGLAPMSYDFTFNRKIYLVGEINDYMAMNIVSQIGILEGISQEDITIVINSPGGSISAGLAIIDAMDASPCNIRTVCSGVAASMAAMILLCGSDGNRFIYKNAEVMLHQPLAGVQGQASDINIVCERITRVKSSLLDIIAKKTSQKKKKLESFLDRDFWLTANEAIDLNICDKIVGKEE